MPMDDMHVKPGDLCVLPDWYLMGSKRVGVYLGSTRIVPHQDASIHRWYVDGEIKAVALGSSSLYPHQVDILSRVEDANG